MESLLIAVGAMVLYLVAYHTYGRFLGSKLFELSREAITPAHAVNDGIDYVPAKKEVLFGHHYTSIAGTGPIVGPALGIIWGWVPALVWVLVGSIVMGAVHDFGALVLSMRHQGRSIGDITADLISPRVRYLFLAIIFLALLIVIAIFALVVAVLFDKYPAAVIPIWVEIPIAVFLGLAIYKLRWPALPTSLAALVLLYVFVVIGAYLPVELPGIGQALDEAGQPKLDAQGDVVPLISPAVIWAVLLFAYAAIASIVPVHRLLQPRDYINGHELFVAMGLLFLGVLFARPELVAPTYRPEVEGAPPIMPFLFITIACGAISGFHSLVSSGTTSKQISTEHDARAIGYGGMLMEGLLAVFVIVAVAGGLGMVTDEIEAEDGSKLKLTGAELWNHRYAAWSTAKGLGAKVAAFVDGSAAMLESLAIPTKVGLTIMGVFVASFACTTLDTATRLQRYAVAELGKGLKLGFLANRYVATAVAVITAAVLALHDGTAAGALILWPLFGATNQLLASLALLVVTVYLARRGKPIYFTSVPCLIMLGITGWAMYHLLFSEGGFFTTEGDLHLAIIGAIVVGLEIWMVIEGAIAIVHGPTLPAGAPAAHGDAG